MRARRPPFALHPSSFGLYAFAAFLWGWAALAMAAEPSVTASVDKAEVIVDEWFSVTVAAQGGRVDAPQLPHAEGIRFDRASPRTSTRTSFSFEKGSLARTSHRSWRYRAQATRPGQLTLPSIAVVIDGVPYLTQEISITAKATQAPDATPPPAAGGPGGSYQGRAGGQPRRPFNPPGGSPLPALEDAVAIESRVDRRRVYQGEALFLVLRLYQLNVRGVQIHYTGGRNIPLPATEGFYAGPVTQEQRTETRNGWEYVANEIRQPLFPTGAGEFTIGSWAWEGYVRGQTRRGIERKFLSLQTDPLEVRVKALPERPPEFSGAVGRFEVKASLMEGAVIQGTPAHLRVRILGQGNPDAIQAPELPAIDWAYVAEPEIKVTHVDKKDWTRIEKEFSYRITPLEAGDLEIPAIRFCYFAPNSGRYQTERVDPIRVHVAPSGESDRLVVVGGSNELLEQKVEVLADDILPLVTETGRLTARRGMSFAYGLAFAAPPLAYAIFSMFLRRRRRFAEDKGYARRHRARARSRKRLKDVWQAADPTETLCRAMAGYLADKYNENEAGMTSDDVRQLMLRHNLDAEVIARYVKVLRACERHRYAVAGLSEDELKALVRGAEVAIAELEAKLDRGGRKWEG